MFRQLFRVAGVILVGVLSFTNIPAKITCDPDWAPNWLLEAATKLNACPSTAVALIPPLLTSAELKGVVAPTSRRMPNTKAMSNNRLELGKIVVALASVGTPQSKQAVGAVKRYDEQAKKTILGIAKLNAASELTAETTIHILEGIIMALNRASLKRKSTRAVNEIISFQQNQVDAWVRGLQDQLRRLHGQSVAVQADLASCDNHLWQIYDTAGAAKGERERADEQLVADAPGVIISFFFGDDTPKLRAPVLKAIEDFGALISATRQAQGVVNKLSEQLAAVIGGIEAAYRYHDKMLVIDMSMEEKINMAVESLQRMKKAVEGAQIGR